jgi:hypothetical protein
VSAARVVQGLPGHDEGNRAAVYVLTTLGSPLHPKAPALATSWRISRKCDPI